MESGSPLSSGFLKFKVTFPIIQNKNLLLQFLSSIYYEDQDAVPNPFPVFEYNKSTFQCR